MTVMSHRSGDAKFGVRNMFHTRTMPPRSMRTNAPARQMHTVDTMTAGRATFLYSVTWKMEADDATIRPPADRPTRNMKQAM